MSKADNFIKELSYYYIHEKYSMELLSKKYGIDLPTMSRIIRDYHLSEKREAYYKPYGGVGKELYKEPKKTFAKNNSSENDILRNMNQSQAALEDAFFS